ncbi:MAG: DUF1330 domain-containing protein [Streptomyces sp.]|uniref:DUF1330 domain-containing protein n=1 Tax=Streptomyces sp. TaxID=1931 RepID=UPI0025DB87BA|nr:DUF1330 domain-containing protein [Streptomyces sp.]MBW8797499.1 DUF1330 domain-containing protein [Streptomyces sp.]
MNACVVIFRERVTDPAEPALCPGSARPARAGHEVTPRVGQGAIESLEGAPFHGVLIHRFPSVADARAWYESRSPACQAALPHRPAGADYRVFVVEGADDIQVR